MGDGQWLVCGRKEELIVRGLEMEMETDEDGGNNGGRWPCVVGKGRVAVGDGRGGDGEDERECGRRAERESVREGTMTMTMTMQSNMAHKTTNPSAIDGISMPISIHTTHHTLHPIHAAPSAQL